MSSPAGIPTLLQDISGGHRLTEKEAGFLLEASGRDVWRIAECADRMREERVGNTVTYVRNQNINVTNICVNACGFCGFSRKQGDPDAYFHDRDAVQGKAARARERNVTEICTVSGLHPDFNADSYVGILTWIREAAPGVHLHASNPMEVAYGAARSGISTVEMAGRLRDAGLGSMCGTAAEILVDRVRSVICPGKVDTATWERIIREVHGLGIPTTATIMYGHTETTADVVRHLAILRSIQDDTGGFTEFVPLSFIHMETPIYRKGLARAGATGREDLLMIAVARLFLDNIPHIQSSWVKLGRKLAQLGLIAGADDLGGTMYEESISKGAGAKDTEFLDPAEMERMAGDLGRPLRQRTTLYDLV
ncbi:MAG TPA: 5-amino-6-(D-ribitylamino)uracil--L-tyrosine 4-hydroxyphenyl transferase CofH [Methanomicrobiales archaeon]|jgi:FO synthase subunit 2|nr:5-amino-6-(D-ribitylamino)uracil--L-tyrosine 4-hydroxyphenyl transferase CofH [Methanomicrobiales archaeon]